MRTAEPIRLGELCRRIGVPYRHARYVLEQRLLPPGLEAEPGQGHHRLLTSSQAFWLAIVLKLKASMVPAATAAKVADFARIAVQGASQGWGWDYQFAPFAGLLETESRWFIDVGDMAYLRLVTDSYPSKEGLVDLGWSHLGRHVAAPGAEPTVIIRVDLTRIARLVAG